MNIKLSYTISGIAPGSKAIIAWYKNGTTVELGRYVLDGIVNPFYGAFVAEGLQPVMYRFEFFESLDGMSLDTQIALPLLIDAALVSEETIMIHHYKVGDGSEETDVTLPYWKTPNENDQTLVDERFAGATYENLTVNIQGIGVLHPDQYDILPSGGITLKNDTVFYNDNYVSIEWHVSKTVTVTPPPSVLAEAIHIINATNGGTFNSDMYGKNNIAHYDTPGVAIMEFGAFGDIPDNTYAIFSTFQGPQRYLSLIFSSNTIPFMGTYRARIDLGQGERVVMGWSSGIGYVLDYKGDYALAGQRINADRQYLNTILSTGSPYDEVTDYVEFDKTEVPRLVSELPVYMTVPLGSGVGQWDYPTLVNLYGTNQQFFPNRAKFGVSADKIRLPVVAGQYMKFVKPGDEFERFGSGPGTVGWGKILSHGHDLMDGQGGDRTNTIVGRGLAGQDAARVFVDGTALVQKTGHGKNEVDHFGQYLAIRI